MNSSVDIQIPDFQKNLLQLDQNNPEKKLSKACLFNLIIFANEGRRILYLEELIGTILIKFPCRIIFIHVNEDPKEQFHVSVSSVLSGIGKGQTACDRITIEASKGQLSRVGSVLFPALISDLPIYLLWGQSPFEEHQIFPSLQPYASRLIIDSECFDQLSLFCRQMEANFNLLHMDIMDMNWALLGGWRDLLSRIFDREAKLQLLKRCKSCTITYNNTKTETIQHPEFRSIYLQGWLASRLGTHFREMEFFEENMLISYFGENNPFIVALQPLKDEKLPSGTILEVAISFTTGESYVIIPKHSLAQALIHESSLNTCSLPYTLPLPNVYSTTTFLNEILHQNVGEHYRKMLHMISQLARSGEQGKT